MFSAMNRVKNRLRNRLNMKHIDERIRNSTHLPKHAEFFHWDKLNKDTPLTSKPRTKLLRTKKVNRAATFSAVGLRVRLIHVSRYFLNFIGFLFAKICVWFLFRLPTACKL